MRRQMEVALQQRGISNHDRQNDKNDDMNDMKAVSIWEEFKGKTTAHGVPHIDTAKGGIKRTFWTFISLVMIAGFLYNLTSITRFFIRYPVSVNIEMMHKSQLVFPAVTLCNMSPVKASALFGTGRRKKRSTSTDKELDAESEIELKKLAGKRRMRRAADDCSRDGIKFRTRCYYASKIKRTFENATKNCAKLDAALVSIVDQAEQDFVQSISIDQGNQDYWIGLELGNGEQKWTDGTAVSYTNWLKTAPDSVGGMCVRMSSGGIWLDMKCTSRYRYVCKTLLSFDTTTEPEATTETTANIMPTSQNIGEETSRAQELQPGPTTELTTEPRETTAQENAVTTSAVKETTSVTAPASVVTSSYQSHVTTTSMIEDFTVSSEKKESTDSFTSTKSSTPGSPDSSPNLQTLLFQSSNQEVSNIKPTESSESPTDTPISQTSTKSDSVLQTSMSCCCTCCMSDGNFQSCSTCSAPNIYNASQCAQSMLEPVETTTTAPETTAFTPTTSKRPQQTATVNGSSFPDRIPVREDFKKEEVFTEILADTPLEDKKKLGFRADDMILDCKFSGHDCYISDFTEFYNSIHGNCYIFNAGWNQSNQLFRSTKAGRRHGLHLVLNINQAEYVKQVGDTAGVRLVIHTQTRMPFPEDEGITISPGHSTSVGIRQLHVVREPDPYGNCSEGIIPNHMSDVYGELYGTQYSTLACQKTCYQKNVVDKCGCGDPYFPMEGAAFNNKKVSACDSNNIEEDDCRYLVNLLFKNNSLDCNCPPQCRESSFILGTSLGVWPSEVQKESILRKLSAKTGIEMTGASYDYKLNLIKLEIHYEEFNFERVTERPAYTVTSYLSDIGGILGLWIGFSLFTIFEFVELLFDWIVYLCARTCNMRKNTKLDEQATTKINVALPNHVHIKCGRSSNNRKTNPEGTPPPPYQNLKKSNKQGILDAQNASHAMKINGKQDFSQTPIRFRRGSQNSYIVNDSPDLLDRKHLHISVDLI